MAAHTSSSSSSTGTAALVVTSCHDHGYCATVGDTATCICACDPLRYEGKVGVSTCNSFNQSNVHVAYNDGFVF
jgi:hypothetical protein